MLHRGDETDPAGCKEWNRFQNHVRIKVHPEDVIDDPISAIHWSMAEMNKHICIPEKFQVKITGPVAGIATDKDSKSGRLQVPGKFRETALQPFRCLEGNPACPPVFQFCDQVRAGDQRSSPCLPLRSRQDSGMAWLSRECLSLSQNRSRQPQPPSPGVCEECRSRSHRC